MIPLPLTHGKKIGVFGLGISGQATIAALYASGAEVYAWDDKPESVLNAQQECAHVHYIEIAHWPWKKLEMLVLAPGIPLTHPQPHLVVQAANVHGCRIVGDIELLAEACPDATLVGITGTNGKSTTTALIAHILKSAGLRCEVGGNLGMAVLSLAPLEKNEIYVVETSSYQLDLLSSTVFNIAVLLNITPDHLDRHGGMDGYIAAKRRIFQGQNATDTAIIGIDTPPSLQLYKELKEGKNRFSWQGKGAKLIPLSTKKQLSDGISVKDGIIDSTLDLAGAKALRGEHNWQNAAAAVAVARALGVADDAILAGMQNFPGLAHRMQIVGEAAGVVYVNDSKATNAEATENALRAYDDLYWILGGKPKEGGIDALTAYFPKIKKAYLIGEAAEAFASVLTAHSVPFQHCGTLVNATRAAHSDARAAGSGVVMLSPACASFDQFRSFEHRGEVFAQEVAGLLAA